MVAAASNNWVPTRLGRYEVLGELATGGMAQILLARSSGASGFERTVVIKRILPHLARDAAFVAMFLDEARIVGGIHHPNVVQVQELCREEDELYLVMEYLEGESLFGLMRRLQRLGRTLPYGLSAYLLAEACDGLHSAHELTDSAGKALNLVHRDVSPHNIFVTYRGAVKVIDFGIAKTDNRTNRTETGQLKGKFEYMSPEQCAAEPCDRRTDVYALGIVLYELITGRRLFKRKNELLTIKAVTEAPIIPPTVLRPDCPGQLEQIVMRALERDRTRRYQSCADMQEDLVRLLRQDKSAEEPAEVTMVRFMGELFAERIDEKRQLIETIAKGSSPKSLPPPEVDLQYAVPELDEDVLRSHTHMRKVGDTRPGAAAPGATVKAPRPEAGGANKAAAAATRVTGSAPRRAPHLDADASPTGSAPRHAPHLDHDSRPRGSDPEVAPWVEPDLDPEPRPAAVGSAPKPAPLSELRPRGSAPKPAPYSELRPRGSAPKPAPHLDVQPAPVGSAPKPAPQAKPESTPSAAGPAAESAKRSRVGLWALLFGAAALAGVLLWIELTPTPGVVETLEAPRRPVREAVPVVTLSIVTDPPGAEVWVDGMAQGPSPVALAVPKDERPVSYEAKLMGYAATFGTVVPSRDERLVLKLSPLQSAPSAAPPSDPTAAPSAHEDPPAHPRTRRTRTRAPRREAAPAPAQPTPRPQPTSKDPFRRFD